MSGHDAERAYVAAVLDARAAQLADTTASMRAEVDRLRESWAGGYDQQLASHQDRMQAMRDETRAWLRAMYDDDEAEEPSPSPDVAAQGQVVDVSAGSSASPARPGPGQRPDPHVAELAAEDIKAMSMQEYAARRANLGVASATSMDRLFGQETR